MLASTVTAALLHLVDCAEAGSPRPVSGDVAINLWIAAGLCTTGYLAAAWLGRRPHRERAGRPGSRRAVASAAPAPDAGREAGRRRGRAARRERRSRRPRRG